MLKEVLVVAVAVVAWGSAWGASSAEASDVPVSPSDPAAYPGLRLWQPPQLTHWPAVIYADEHRNVAYRIPVPSRPELDRERGFERSAGAYHNPFAWGPGSTGAITWQHWPSTQALPIVIDEKPMGEAVSGLIAFPNEVGQYTAKLTLAGETVEMPLQVVSAERTWPHRQLRAGHAVDEQNRAVVLVVERPDPATARRWQFLRASAPRSVGPTVVVGDQLAWPGGSSWHGLEASAIRLPIDAQAHIDHATFTALASWEWGACGVMVWSPGNQPILAGGWQPGEERVMLAISQRWAALGRQPRLLLVLPPLPIDSALSDVAQERRALLRRTAEFLDWDVLDAHAVVGGPEQANVIAEGVYTTYPCADAGRRLAAALATRVGSL